MFVNNVTVNGVALKVAFIRSDENGFSVTGMTDSGHTMEVEFSFCDGMRLVAEVKEVAPAKKERKPRKAMAQPEVVEVAAEVAPVVEMATDEQYAEYLTQRASGKRGRAPKAIAAYIAAHNL